MFPRAAFAVIGVALLAGCTVSPTPDPDVTDPRPPGDVEADDCVVGTWTLDVPAFAGDSESYLVSIGLPLESFALDGAGKLTFTADGLVSTEISITTTVSIAGNVISAPSEYTATGDWSRTDDEKLQFDNWSRVGDTADIPPEVDLPGLDLTQLADVTAECSSDELFLQGADAPFGAYWTR